MMCGEVVVGCQSYADVVAVSMVPLVGSPVLPYVVLFGSLP
jgi:hypothetical protein